MSTRDEIIAAALRLARTQGFGALSVRGVAREAGVGATTLRHHFPSQSDLHHVVAAGLVHDSLEDLAIEDASRDPSQRLYECLAQLLPPQEDQSVVLEGWFELYRLSLGPNSLPGVRELLESGHRSAAQVLHRWLNILAAEGHIRSEDIEGQVTYALALVDGLHLTMLLQPDRVDLEVAKDTLRRLTAHLVKQ